MSKRIDVTVVTGQSVIIDSENKQVISKVGNNEENGYNNINHSYNTFVIAKPGKTTITATNGTFDIEVKNWVVD